MELPSSSSARTVRGPRLSSSGSRPSRLFAMAVLAAIALSGCVGGDASRLAQDAQEAVARAPGIADAEGSASIGPEFESRVAVTASAEPGTGPAGLGPAADAWRSLVEHPDARDHDTVLVVEGIDGGRTLTLAATPEQQDTARMLEAWEETGFTRLSVERTRPEYGSTAPEASAFTARVWLELADPASADAADIARWGGTMRLEGTGIVALPELTTAEGSGHSGRASLGSDRDEQVVRAWQGALGAAAEHDGEPMTSSTVVWERDGAVAVEMRIHERRRGGTPTPSPGAPVPDRADALCADARSAVAESVDGRGYALECSWEGESVLEESRP